MEKRWKTRFPHFPFIPHRQNVWHDSANHSGKGQQVLPSNGNIGIRFSAVIRSHIYTNDPYDLLACPQLGTYLATYENTRPALATAVHVFFGEIEAQGHLSVTLSSPPAPQEVEVEVV